MSHGDSLLRDGGSNAATTSPDAHIAKAAQQTARSASSRPSSKATFHLVAGLASGFTSSILLQPADLLKTRVQQSRSTSVWTTLKQIMAAPQPVKQLWRGTLPSTIRTSVGSALYFATLNRMRSALAASPTLNPNLKTSTIGARSTASSKLPALPPGLNLLSGAVARASVGFVMMPVTVLKVRYESNMYAYKSLFGATRAIFASNGIRGFFAGFGATALRDAPYAGVYVLFYEWGKGALGRLASSSSPSSADSKTDLNGTAAASVNFVSGGLAAMAATAVTNPPDAVKTRLQLMPGRYTNTLQAARLMLAEEGIRSMFDGLGLRMARKALSSALAWTVYEEVVRRAERRWDEQAVS